MREEESERPYSSDLHDETREGLYHCRGCDLGVYDSAAKYDSGTGWPSFSRSLAERGTRTPRGNRIEKKYLYCLLNNRAYIGEAVHKGDSYPGEHDAIIGRETWDSPAWCSFRMPMICSSLKRLLFIVCLLQWRTG